MEAFEKLRNILGDLLHLPDVRTVGHLNLYRAMSLNMDRVMSLGFKSPFLYSLLALGLTSHTKSFLNSHRVKEPCDLVNFSNIREERTEALS